MQEKNYSQNCGGLQILIGYVDPYHILNAWDPTFDGLCLLSHLNVNHSIKLADLLQSESMRIVLEIFITLSLLIPAAKMYSAGFWGNLKDTWGHLAWNRAGKLTESAFRNGKSKCHRRDESISTFSYRIQCLLCI